jgi:uncharacterized protein YqiB (DUF1249 family)
LPDKAPIINKSAIIASFFPASGKYRSVKTGVFEPKFLLLIEMNELLTRHPAHDIGAARTFDGLMDIYEQNYIRLRQLIPDFQKIGAHAVSAAPGRMDLHYECLQCSKYTTVFRLTHKFETLEPNLEIRVYHDARVAEVLASNVQSDDAYWDGQHRITSLFRADVRNLRSKWRLNRFLQKWLQYCLQQGHKFVPRSSTWISGIAGDSGIHPS